MSNTEPDQSPLTPGQLLSNARKKQDITVETIAEGLRLDPLLIQALENDEYEKFPAMAYVRGFLRGYANLVNINPNELVSTFDKKINAAPILEPFASRPEQQAGSGDRHIRVVTYSLIGVLLLLLGLWWQTQRTPSIDPVDKEIKDTVFQEPEVEQLEVMEGTSGELSLDTNVKQSVEENEESAVADEEETVTTDEVQAAETDDTVQPMEAEGTDVDEEKTEVASESTSEKEISESAESSEVSIENTDSQTGIDSEATTESQIEDKAESTVQATNDKGLVMKFSDDSWIQITDANDKKQFSRLGKSGEVVNVGGEQPYKVIIGKASAVSMSYQGKEIDLKSLSKDEVARFVIDKTGAHK